MRHMEILHLLIPASLVLAFAVGAIAWWAVTGGQFGGRDTRPQRTVMDSDAQRGDESRRHR
jgi:cbb3-type cytochrome oxidase maturation protein